VITANRPQFGSAFDAKNGELAVSRTGAVENGGL